MNGARSILETLNANGIDVVFTNPGTSEMQFVAALDMVEGIKPVLSLFEGVCTGAADGYGRIAGKPAATLLHLGPGLANGLANLHNAKRAGTSIINIVGDHATYHLEYDAPLTSDIHGLAAPMSHIVLTLNKNEHVTTTAQTAIDEAHKRGGQIVTLIVPSDLAWSQCTTILNAPKAKSKDLQINLESLRKLSEALRITPSETMLLLSGGALTDRGIIAAARIRQATGCRVATPTFVRRLPRGGSRPHFESSPYLSEMAVPFYASVKTLGLIDASAPVAFFAYPDKQSRLTPDGCELINVAEGDSDPEASLVWLADQLDAHPYSEPSYSHVPMAPPIGQLTADKIAVSLQRHMPEQAIIVDEAITNSLPLIPTTQSAPFHDWLHLTGGSIGQGMPVATGAALAAPNRKVINLEGDGSALYTIQALWTQARENLDVVTVIYNNSAYQILQLEMMRTGTKEIGKRAMSTLCIDKPSIDFRALSKSFGVDAERVETAEEFDTLLEQALQKTGPFLIEAIVT